MIEGIRQKEEKEKSVDLELQNCRKEWRLMLEEWW